MYFDIAAFLRYNFRAFFKTRGEHYRLTPKRFLILVIWLMIYIPAQLINRLCFLLDEIFFPKYRKQEIQKPIFIIGNPRSGTTFLHRLLHKDTDSFTAFTVWELALAPSITQRRIIWAFVKAGRWIGNPIRHRVNLINKRLKQSKVNPAHTIKVEEAEEEEHIMIHNWTSETLFAIYPYRDEVLPYFFFDRDIPKEKQRKVMSFYKKMIQKHIYAHGGNKILLSKNPSYSSRIAALTETFPDAHFIKLVRNPFEAVPSMLDSMSIGLNIFCDPLEPYPFKDDFIELMKFYYLYPVEYFKDKKDKCNFIKYDDLVQHPDEIVKDLYAWLGLNYSKKFAAIVNHETHAAHHYHSKHEYPLEKMGLTEERIFREFEEVFSYYEFDNHDYELPDREMFWQLRNWPQFWKTQSKQRQPDNKMGKLQNENFAG
ncbi:MAG: sulfotransferase [Chloroflexi bacterium]|nr:sulfotransferase [Chloroflexota bacterium]